MATTNTPTKPIFAEDMNPEQLSAPLQSLLEEKQWTLDEEGMGVAKTYYFKTYTKCLVRFCRSFLVFLGRSGLDYATNIFDSGVPGFHASSRHSQ